MKLQELQTAIYNIILMVIKYMTELFKEQKEQIKVEVHDEVIEEINYYDSFNPPSDNDKQINIEEIAEEVIERITENYILLKKDN